MIELRHLYFAFFIVCLLFTVFSWGAIFITKDVNIYQLFKEAYSNRIVLIILLNLLIIILIILVFVFLDNRLLELWQMLLIILCAFTVGPAACFCLYLYWKYTAREEIILARRRRRRGY